MGAVLPLFKVVSFATIYPIKQQVFLTLRKHNKTTIQMIRYLTCFTFCSFKDKFKYISNICSTRFSHKSFFRKFRSTKINQTFPFSHGISEMKNQMKNRSKKQIIGSLSNQFKTVFRFSQKKGRMFSIQLPSFLDLFWIFKIMLLGMHQNMSWSPHNIIARVLCISSWRYKKILTWNRFHLRFLLIRVTVFYGLLKIINIV